MSTLKEGWMVRHVSPTRLQTRRSEFTALGWFCGRLEGDGMDPMSAALNEMGREVLDNEYVQEGAPTGLIEIILYSLVILTSANNFLMP
jgi:hypothetical protein